MVSTDTEFFSFQTAAPDASPRVYTTRQTLRRRINYEKTVRAYALFFFFPRDDKTCSGNTGENRRASFFRSGVWRHRSLAADRVVFRPTSWPKRVTRCSIGNTTENRVFWFHDHYDLSVQTKNMNCYRFFQLYRTESFSCVPFLHHWQCSYCTCQLWFVRGQPIELNLKRPVRAEMWYRAASVPERQNADQPIQMTYLSIVLIKNSALLIVLIHFQVVRGPNQIFGFGEMFVIKSQRERCLIVFV